MLVKELLKHSTLESTPPHSEEFSYDYIGILKDSIPYIRNEYAHGSNYLGMGSYLHLLIVSEFINQLFEKP